MLLKILLSVPRGGILLIIMSLVGHSLLMVCTRVSMRVVTTSAGCLSASLPPHCSTIRSGFSWEFRMFLTRLCRSGTVAPRYIYVVAETPSLLRRGPRPCMRDVPMTTVVVLWDGGCWGRVRTAAGGACCWCWLPTKLACPWAAEAAASTWWRPVPSCTTGMGRPTCPVVCTGWEGCRLWGTGGATG